MKNRLDAFELWCYRRMLKMKWMDTVSNTEILIRVKEEKTIIKHIHVRTTAVIGHILQHGELLQTTVKESINGTMYNADDMCKRLVADRKKWRARLLNQTNCNDRSEIVHYKKYIAANTLCSPVICN